MLCLFTKSQEIQPGSICVALISLTEKQINGTENTPLPYPSALRPLREQTIIQERESAKA